MSEVRIRHRQGGFALEAAFALEMRWTVLFGASGAGKSTVLRVVAGLVRPQDGRVRLGERTVLDTDGGVDVAAGRRAIGFVTQQAALFPHLTVRENVGFGLRALARERRAERVAEMLRLFGAEELAERGTAGLSGGERQRVALARALAPGPELLLLDEPLAALDDASSQDILSRLLALEVKVLYVSHDLAEIWRIPGEVVVLEQGRVTATGPLQQVLAPYRDRLVRLLG